MKQPTKILTHGKNSDRRRSCGNRRKTVSPLSESSQKPAKAGGFAFPESIIDGIANLSPEHKARKEIVVTGADKKKDRSDLLGIIKVRLFLKLCLSKK